MANPELGPDQRTGTPAVTGPWAADVGAGEADDNDRQLRRLAAFLEDAAGFQLALVTCDDRELRERQLERLAQRLQRTDVWLTRLDFIETPQEKQLLERLRAHLDAVTVPEGKRPAVMVVGIEATLDYSRLGRQSGQGLAMLENANAQRDAFARHCPVAVAFWLNPTATSLFALHAPDLWHWRNGTFRFTAAAVSRREFEERLIGMPLVETESLPRRAKLERIVSLHDLVAELDTSSEGPTRRGRQRRATLLGELGIAYLAMGEARPAIAILEEALLIAREIGDRRGEGNALGNLGNAYAALGDARKAIEYYEQYLAIAREIGDRRGEGNALGNLGSAHAALGDARKAIEYYEQQKAIVREIGDRQGECAALGNLGDEWRKLGETEKARDCVEQGLQLALLAGDPLRIVQVAWLLGWVYADTGDAATAVALEAFALARFQAMGYPQARAAGARLARYREEMGENEFLEALARSEQVVADLFRSLAGEPAAAMAGGILQALAEVGGPPDAAE